MIRPATLTNVIRDQHFQNPDSHQSRCNSKENCESGHFRGPPLLGDSKTEDLAPDEAKDRGEECRPVEETQPLRRGRGEVVQVHIRRAEGSMCGVHLGPSHSLEEVTIEEWGQGVPGTRTVQLSKLGVSKYYSPSKF